MTNFPKQITFISDKSVAEFVDEIPKQKERIANYVFIKAKVNEGVKFPMTLLSIDRLFQCKLLKIK